MTTEEITITIKEQMAEQLINLSYYDIQKIDFDFYLVPKPISAYSTYVQGTTSQAALMDYMAKEYRNGNSDVTFFVCVHGVAITETKTTLPPCPGIERLDLHV